MLQFKTARPRRLGLRAPVQEGHARLAGSIQRGSVNTHIYKHQHALKTTRRDVLDVSKRQNEARAKIAGSKEKTWPERNTSEGITYLSTQFVFVADIDV